MRICVIGGTGYVGLITGIGLAEVGHDVVNVDLDEIKVRALAAGDMHLHEAGLPAVLRENLHAGRLRFTTDHAEAIAHGEIIFITVATPTLDDGRPDVSQVIRAVEEVRTHLTGYRVVAVKSTIPVATIEHVVRILREAPPGAVCDVVVNPEFLREGQGLSDFLWPPRIVIGTHSERARWIMRELYHPIVVRQVRRPDRMANGPNRPVPVVETDPASATMIKYASNAFLATRIAFIDEIAWICEQVGADIRDVARGMGYDARIGHRYLEAGLGYGGPCLEKDLRALLQVAADSAEQSALLRSVAEHNDRQIRKILEKVRRLVGQRLSGQRIAVFGLAFKGGTNDIRNSLALRVIDALEDAGAVIRAHDPAAIPEARAVRPQLVCTEDPHESVRGAVALLILTDWPDYRALDFQRIRDEMARPAIFDGRNLLNAHIMERLGFAYLGIGQGTGRLRWRDEAGTARSVRAVR